MNCERVLEEIEEDRSISRVFVVSFLSASFRSTTAPGFCSDRLRVFLSFFAFFFIFLFFFLLRFLVCHDV